MFVIHVCSGDRFIILIAQDWQRSVDIETLIVYKAEGKWNLDQRARISNLLCARNDQGQQISPMLLIGG